MNGNGIIDEYEEMYQLTLNLAQKFGSGLGRMKHDHVGFLVRGERGRLSL